MYICREILRKMIFAFLFISSVNCSKTEAKKSNQTPNEQKARNYQNSKASNWVGPGLGSDQMDTWKLADIWNFDVIYLVFFLNSFSFFFFLEGFLVSLTIIIT